MLIDPGFMSEAISEARIAASLDEVPVGAVVVREGVIIARAHNETECRRDASAHAELLALKRASEASGSRYLDDCVLYVTLEPCVMCAGACVNYRLGAAVFGAFDPNAGAMGSVIDAACGLFSWEIPVYGGVMGDECAELLTSYFKNKRS